MKLKPLVSIMTLFPVMFLPTSTAIFASDLEIYKGNLEGKTSIFLMLDTSGSMGISSLVMPKNNLFGSPGDVNESLCQRVEVNEGANIWEWAYNLKGSNGKTAILKTVTIGSTPINYYVRGCQKIIAGKTITEYDRLSRLKDALLPLLAKSATSGGLSEDISMGLGHYSSKTDLNIGNSGNKLTDSHSGRIMVPVGKLTSEQRIKIARKIADIKSVDSITDENGDANSRLKFSSTQFPNIMRPSSGTPTAQAYAEAAALMMGTGTGYNQTIANLKKVDYIYDGYMVKQYKNQEGQAYFICVTLGPGRVSNALGNVKQCPSSWPGYNSSNKTISNNSPVYKPNGNNDWTSVTPAQLKAEVGEMNSTWDIYKKLPIGWRLDGWMKVENEPMDIETMGGVVYSYNNTTANGTNEGAVIRGLVAYRTNPFALQETSNGHTINTLGGFQYSEPDTKKTDNSNTYIAGGSKSSCDGNGIYFLTDGAPNSSQDIMAHTIMNQTLANDSRYAFQQKPNSNILVSPKLRSDLFSGETGSWEYIGEYSKKLLDPSKNPAGMKIRTAVVGFGSSFEDLNYTTEQYVVKENNIEVTKTRKIYDCDTPGASLDAKNACKWGSSSFGDGGFYQATNSEDITNSIVDFINKIQVNFTSSSLGSISVPRDPLDQTKYMTQGFFPMVLPTDKTSVRIWIGNLKKYNVIGGTLKDASGDAIYKVENDQQVINSNAKDLWSATTLSGTDHSQIKSGGSWNKIPVPSSAQEIADVISNINSVRKVYTMDGTSLKAVSKANLATDYSGSDAFTNPLSVNQRIAFLNYLGYPTTFPTTASTLTTRQINTLAVNPSSPYRFLGGVVHSTPLMVTKEAMISVGNKAGLREEYTVYGSMEGGLHIVNAATGKEQSVFVPKEVLDNQYDTLARENSEGVNGLSGLTYGVDAPWVADNTFKVETKTANSIPTTKYIADKINIYGGLRMGGKALYGLDILNPSAPELLFHITPSSAGFGRMAQIWSKPTLAEIRVKGIRTKVLIFGGGYDADVYEKPAASFMQPTKTLGNSLYIVDAKTGVLIWMSSADTDGIAAHKKTTQIDMKYSIVGQPAVRDYDADGLADMIYFADLGGQIFRVDLNNVNQMSASVDTNIAIRVHTLAKLRTGSGATEFVPRFYERVSTAVFDEGQERFVMVTAGSGNRSFPLEEEQGGSNKIYGLIDRDAAASGLEKSNFVVAPTILPVMLSNSGVLGKTVTKQIANTEIAKMKIITGNNLLRGWSFELKSVNTGNYSRSFEESQLIAGDLFVNVYDPKASLSGTSNACGGGITGLSTTHRICMPYGDCAAYLKSSYQGIIGPSFGVADPSNITQTTLIGPISEDEEFCIGKCRSENSILTQQKISPYVQNRKMKPVRWYEW